MSAVVSAPLHMVEAVAALRLPPVADRRLGILMDRNNNGILNSEEREELASLVELSETISLIRADALELLGRAPQWVQPQFSSLLPFKRALRTDANTAECTSRCKVQLFMLNIYCRRHAVVQRSWVILPGAARPATSTNQIERPR